MCGIGGLLATSPTGPDPVRRLLHALEHRGPDEGAVLAWSSGRAARVEAADSPTWPGPAPVWLGSRRLRVLDTSPAGRQPLSNEDGTIWVVHNGEIYNSPELRRMLESKGHEFRTQTDTEVVAHLYEELGPAAVRELRGMFATAILDTNRQHVHLFRDRLGIKPLYWCRTADGKLLFGSEVRALLATGLVPRRISLAGLHTYLLFGAVQEPLTLVDGVRSVPPAHRATIDLTRLDATPGLPTTEAYWDLAAVSQRPERTGPDEIRDRLEEAVESHLLTDVPLGAFLSGGLDSGAIVGLMARATRFAPGAARRPATTRTFTLAFREAEYSEAEEARATAALHATDHAEAVITSDSVLQDLPRILAAMDQPTLDGVNTWLVSREARTAGLTVALSGLGGDEIFAGYASFRRTRTLERLARVAASAPRLSRWCAAVLTRIPGRSMSVAKTAALLCGDAPLANPYLLQRAVFMPSQVAAIVPHLPTADEPAWAAWEAHARETLAAAEGLDPVARVSIFELRHYLLSTLLRDADQMSMAHALEIRVPFLDHPLVEAVLNAPCAAKLHRRVRKPLLAQAAAGCFPEGATTRVKRTFTLPWEQWLRGPMRRAIEHSLAEPPAALNRLIEPAAVARIWGDFLAGHTTWSRPWSLHVLYEWVRLNIDVQPTHHRTGREHEYRT